MANDWVPFLAKPQAEQHKEFARLLVENAALRDQNRRLLAALSDLACHHLGGHSGVDRLLADLTADTTTAAPVTPGTADPTTPATERPSS